MNVYVLISIAVLTFILIVLLIRYASLFGLVDRPNKRSMHHKITPRGAGIAFVASIFISLLLFDPQYLKEYDFIYLAIVLVWVGGIWDDIKSVSPKTKFIFILIASVILFSEKCAVFDLGTYFGYHVILPQWLAYLFTFFAIAGYTNALNLMDGLDGLAASVSMVIFSTFLIIGIQYDDTLLISLSTFFIVSLIVFLAFNWHPAKIFMGDSGSLALGFAIAVLTIRVSHYVTPASVLFMIALPLLDTFVVMTRRKQRHRSLFEADKNHLHHLLYNVKGDIPFTVIMFVMMQLLFSLIAIQVKNSNDLLTLILFVILFMLYFNLFDQRLKRRKK